MSERVHLHAEAADVEVREELTVVNRLLPPRGPWALESGCQSQKPGTLPIDPSGWSNIRFLGWKSGP